MKYIFTIVTFLVVQLTLNDLPKVISILFVYLVHVIVQIGKCNDVFKAYCLNKCPLLNTLQLQSLCFSYFTTYC